MKVVADTNTVVSGLLWDGAPREILVLAREEKLTLYTSPSLLAELEDVLLRPKFLQKLQQVEAAPRELVLQFAALACVVRPERIAPVILIDPDDAVLACAVTAGAQMIVSGDTHLLALNAYAGIPILNARSALHELTRLG